MQAEQLRADEDGLSVEELVELRGVSLTREELEECEAGGDVPTAETVSRAVRGSVLPVVGMLSTLIWLTVCLGTL